MAQYPTPKYRRTAFAPAILGAIVLLAGLALLDNPGGYLFIRFGVAILALIVVVFAWQAKHWWWLLPLAAIAVAWNPIYPPKFSGQWWVAAQFVAALVFIAAGILIRIRNPEDRNKRS
ncbi:MAG: hypothetical protein JWN80_866 [Microbacteriaceae bacterium]|jgi:hypothetical protein|nr:hypothetical protein [Microbacteriaceae bacterium]